MRDKVNHYCKKGAEAPIKNCYLLLVKVFGSGFGSGNNSRMALATSLAATGFMLITEGSKSGEIDSILTSPYPSPSGPTVTDISLPTIVIDFSTSYAIMFS